MESFLWAAVAVPLALGFALQAWRHRRAENQGLLTDQVAALMARIEARKRPNWVADKWR